MQEIETAVKSIGYRFDDYDKAEQYYTGDVDEVFTDPRLRRALGAAGADYRTNFCAPCVDAVVNRLEIASITAAQQGGDQIIGELWEKNSLALESGDIHRNALIYGDSYAIVWPDEEHTQIFYNSPKGTVVLYDPENPRRKLAAAKLWAIKENGVNYHRLNIYLPDRTEKFIARGEQPPSDPAKWDVYSEAVENPWGEVPVFHFRTHRPYGRPEHIGGYGAQDAINKLVVTQMAVVDYQGAPQRYALAGNHQSNEISDFDEDATDRENMGALQNGPGELWYLKGIDQVGQFDAADPKAFLDPMREYVRAIATATATPLHYFEKAGFVPSGESLRVSESPLNKKIRDRQQSFGATWRDLFRFALRIEGMDSDVQVKWERHESTDEGTEWELAAKKLRAGLPLRQVLLEKGYDAELVDKWIDEGARPLIPGITPELLGEEEVDA